MKELNTPHNSPLPKLFRCYEDPLSDASSRVSTPMFENSTRYLSSLHIEISPYSSIYRKFLKQTDENLTETTNSPLKRSNLTFNDNSHDTTESKLKERILDSRTSENEFSTKKRFTSKILWHTKPYDNNNYSTRSIKEHRNNNDFSINHMNDDGNEFSQLDLHISGEYLQLNLHKNFEILCSKIFLNK